MANSKPSSQPIAIVGQGAIGGLLGVRCQQLGFTYHHLVKEPHQRPLELTNLKGEHEQFPTNNLAITAKPKFNTLIIPVKAYQVMPALAQLSHVIEDHHVLVLLHNGLGTIEQVRQRYAKNPLIAGTTSYGAYKPNADKLVATGVGQTHFGWIHRPNKHIAGAVENDLSPLLPPTTWHQDISLALWHKLAINAAINPLTALNKLKNGQLQADKYQAQILAVCNEINLLLKALGYPSDTQNLLQKVNQVISATANNYSSMHQDIAQKRRTEIDFINGYVVTKGQELGISTLHNKQLVEQIKLMESTYR